MLEDLPGVDSRSWDLGFDNPPSALRRLQPICVWSVPWAPGDAFFNRAHGMLAGALAHKGGATHLPERPCGCFARMSRVPVCQQAARAFANLCGPAY
jgi:hypothetical protein